MPRRSADKATMAADLRQLSTAPEKPAPLINGVDWSINQDRLVDPSVQEFQKDLVSYKNTMKDFQAAQKKVEELEKPKGKPLDAGEVKEPMLFNVPKSSGPVASGIRTKVEEMENSE